MNRLKLYCLFFTSTLKINVSLSFLFCFLISTGDWEVFFIFLPYMLGGLGILTSLLYKEILEKKDYYFYYNAGISKRFLVIFTIIIYWLIIWIIKLCIILLKLIV